MSYAERHTVAITTSTGGLATGHTPVVTGRISAIIYTRPTGTPFASTADVTVTTEDSGQSIWAELNVNASETNYPLVAGNLQSGAASTLTEVPLYAANERVKIAIAQGGNAKAGTFIVVIA
ncbi:MAG: hypothetical protein ABUJ92_00385 [Desulfobacterales bacterium]